MSITRSAPQLAAPFAIVIGVTSLGFGWPQDGTTQDSVSAELKSMYEADQSERSGGRISPERDRARLERVKALLSRDLLKTGPDYYHAGMIMQHSADRTGRDHLVAHVLATTAALKGHEPGRWLAAAALDRFLVFNQLDQFFGTQFERDSTGRWDAGRFDRWRTDSIREMFNVPPVDSLRRRAARWN